MTMMMVMRKGVPVEVVLNLSGKLSMMSAVVFRMVPLCPIVFFFSLLIAMESALLFLILDLASGISDRSRLVLIFDITSTMDMLMHDGNNL